MSQRSTIVGVQYLRGFCALAVVVDHSSGMVGAPKYLGRAVFDGVLVNGRVGVDIFFVISGFIISIVALQGAELRPALTAKSFFYKRFARIVPLMWVAVATHFLLRLANHSPDLVPINYARGATLFPVGQIEPSPVWTLRQEMLFYLFFALSFLGRRRMGWLLALWCVAPIAWSIASGTLTRTHDDVGFIGIVASPANLEFGAGVLVGVAWLRSRGRSAIVLPVSPFLALGSLTLAVIVASALFPVIWLSVPNAALTGVLGAALIWVAANVSCPDGALSRLGQLLGNASYSVYLFHMHVVAIMLGLLHRFDPQIAPLFGLVLVSVGAVLAGIAIHLVIEKPLVRRVQQWLAPRPALSPVVVRDL